ncbi:hypothetical protein ACR8AL_01150 [Clavibacter sepedonicus]|uniref:Membrane protein n=1 Tax=Clavibacter sepedonicus TaxID=31964 RepID=B0RER4_CLASE|nr:MULTISPECIES: hypothetical protein [Clavibacter]MBD5382979.1 hypothetical protein [Clavibacter sp.]OQJ49274.1 hypothetical protein B5P19_14290 [Clavibacter sepedonicus]OQJ54889.1 hypothetical protein B5P20_12870 [Clavibacter sepedonicus]UUK64883.1 hypothetical protein LRE50_11365 [Clavibacter sepedonicus]CAQ00911.1 putative membrane protein [Clavibacter sepedonicus]
MPDLLEKALQVVTIVCLIGMGVSSFRALNHTSRTNEPAPRSMYLAALPFAVVGLLAIIAGFAFD